MRCSRRRNSSGPFSIAKGSSSAARRKVAYVKRFITRDELRGLVSRYGKTAYGRYLLQLLDEPDTRQTVKRARGFPMCHY